MPSLLQLLYCPICPSRLKQVTRSKLMVPAEERTLALLAALRLGVFVGARLRGRLLVQDSRWKETCIIKWSLIRCSHTSRKFPAPVKNNTLTVPMTHMNTQHTDFPSCGTPLYMYNNSGVWTAVCMDESGCLT